VSSRLDSTGAREFAFIKSDLSVALRDVVRNGKVVDAEGHQNQKDNHVALAFVADTSSWILSDPTAGVELKFVVPIQHRPDHCRRKGPAKSEEVHPGLGPCGDISHLKSNLKQKVEG
jgi:hypothetical protein